MIILRNLGTLLNRLFGTNFDVMSESARRQTTKGTYLKHSFELHLELTFWNTLLIRYLDESWQRHECFNYGCRRNRRS